MNKHHMPHTVTLCTENCFEDVVSYRIYLSIDQPHLGIREYVSLARMVISQSKYCPMGYNKEI